MHCQRDRKGQRDLNRRVLKKKGFNETSGENRKRGKSLQEVTIDTRAVI